MPTSQGKIYFGASLVAQPGEQWDYTLAYPPDAGTSATWTIPGTLQATFTTSGTYTPAAGVSTVHVLVVGGGGNGGNGADPGGGGGGGTGGGVRVYRSVPVSGDVTVTIGGPGTASSFGALSSIGGSNGGTLFPGRFLTLASGGVGKQSSGGSPSGGMSGYRVNGTDYAGGGGGGGSTSGAGGGSGGGGTGSSSAALGTNGTNGLGGGGGGGGSTGNNAGRSGGSGRVMIWTEDL